MTLLFLFCLLVLSGSFSASETALFSLEPEARGRIGARAQRLLADPRALLVSILLGNLVVNLLIFALAPAALRDIGIERPVVAGFTALVAVLLTGEILPKALALRTPEPIARAAALPLTLLVRAITPARRVISMVLDFLLRLTGEEHRRESGVSPDALAELVERSRERGVLRHGEADLLAEIVELGDMRVRELMTPRVDVLFLERDATESQLDAVLEDARRRRLAWMPVVVNGADNVVGSVEVRDILVRPDRSVASLMMPTKFFPEVGSVLALLQVMREDRISEAVVVDEWGGTAGVITLEDVFEALVGELLVEGEEKEVEVVPIGERTYRVSGSLSVRDWNDWLGFEIVPNAFETVGGYVTAMLGRIPRRGDRVPLRGGLECEVDEVRGRRLRTLLIEFTGDVRDEEGWR
ncbi:MAG: hemolysin family protein [Planctomycetota bacterium]